MKIKLAILGVSGSGKSTVSRIIEDVLGPRVQTIAFAGPLKDFAGKVFDFSHEQLWGPSEARNAADPRYTFLAEGSVEAKQAARERFELIVDGWLEEVLPYGLGPAWAKEELRKWLEDCLGQRQVTPRYVLQTLGTEWGRKMHKHIWSLAGVRRADELLAGEVQLVIVNDLRFLNEAEDWTAAGGVIVQVVRPGWSDEAVKAAGVAGHVSEMEPQSPEMQSFIGIKVINDGTLEDLEQRVLGLLKELYGGDSFTA